MKLGSVVEWSSSANGTTKTKRAEVLLIIPPGVTVWPDDLRRWIGPDYRKLFNDASLGWGSSRNHKSYLVVVKGKGKAKLYWPRVSALRLVEDAEVVKCSAPPSLPPAENAAELRELGHTAQSEMQPTPYELKFEFEMGRMSVDEYRAACKQFGYEVSR